MKNIKLYILICFVIATSNAFAQCPAPNSGGVSNCGPGTYSVEVTTYPGSMDYIHRWYTVQTGGYYITSSAVQQGTPSSYYTTSTYTDYFSTTTTLYVSTYNTATYCESTRTPITFTITSPPDAYISVSGSPDAVCSNDAGFTLTASPSGGSSYQWRLNGNTISGATGITYHPSQSGSYTVVVGTSCGNVTSPTQSVTIITPAALTTSISGPSSICQGNNASFTASIPAALTSSVNYHWYVNSDTVGTNSPNLSLSSLNNGNIVKCITSVKNSSICATPSSVTSNSITVTVNSIPSAPAAINASSDCGATQLTLQANNYPGIGITHTWYTSPGGSDLVSGVSVANPSYPYLTQVTQYFSGTTTYYVSASNTCGVSSRTPVTATIGYANSPTITPSSSPYGVCANDNSFHLTASNGSSYQWKLNGTVIGSATSQTYHPTQTGNYSVSVGTACGIVDASAQSVTIITPTNLTASINGPSSICQGDNASFTASVPASLTGSVNYQWYVNSGTVGTNSPNLSLSSLNNGNNISCVVTLNANAFCATPNSVTSIILPITVYGVPYPPQVTISSRIGDGIVSFAIANPNGAYTYQWHKANETTINTGLSWSEQLSENGQVTYYVKAINSNNCPSSETSFNVYAYESPKIVSTPAVMQKGGSATLSLNRTYDTYQWINNGTDIPNATSATYIASMPGNYSIRVGINGVPDHATSEVKLVSYAIQSQSDQNFVLSYTLLRAGERDENNVDVLPVDSTQEAVTYFDGLGRPIQSIITQGSPNPNRRDIIQPIAYDALGREPIKYLPYAASLTDVSDGTYKSNALTSQPAFYQTAGFSAADSAYSRTVFEASPLNRVLEQGTPGSEGQLMDMSGSSNGHTQKMVYTANGADEVLLLQVDGSGQLINTGGDVLNGKSYYQVDRLYKNVIKNENWTSSQAHTELNTSEEFKDNNDHVLLKRNYVMDGTGTTLLKTETYYVYDDFEQLRYVIPPQASATIAFPADTSNSVIKSLCYYYQYDARKRMVIKKLPGAAPVYMVYDLRDRLVLTQDGHQRTTNQWMFTKYDCFNRPVMNGIRQITSPASLAGVQGLVDTYYSTPSTPPPGYAENTNTSTVGYSLNQSYSNDVTEANLLTITYYDNNLFTGFQSFAGSTDLGVTSYNSKVITKVTGGRVRVLGDNTHWYISTTYYDDRYRPIQSIKDNYLSGTERITNLYDFPGKILRSYSQHNGLQAVNENRWFSYDHAGRLLSIYHQIDGQPARVLMSSMTYNELGQLQNKKIHSTDVSYFNYLQSIDYRYNIRGWLTKLNDPQTVGLPHSSEGNLIIKPDAFGMELRYTNPF